MSSGGVAKKKQLFGDEDGEAPQNDPFAGFDGGEAGGGADLKVNKSYAEKHEAVKRKQELQKLTARYGKDAGDTDSDEETEDSDGDLYDNPKKDALFADVLYKLRTNDPSIMDKEQRFFAGLESSSDDEDDAVPATAAGGKKKFTMADEYRKRAVEGDDEAHNNVDDETVNRALKRGPQDAKQKAQKAAFLSAVGGEEEGAADADTEGAVFKKKTKSGTQDEVDAELADLAKTKKKTLKKAFKAGAADKGISEEEAFLANFFAADNWKNLEEDGGAPKNFNLEQVEADEEDERFFDEAEIWEQEYQQQKYRHEEGEEAQHIETFPRDQEGLLRKKDSTRKEARDRKKDREKAEENRAVEELKRLKTLKMREIEDQRRLISEVAGLKSTEDKMKAKMLEKLDLSGDWDPDAHSKMMAEMFGDDFYDLEDDDLDVDSEFEDEDKELLEATAQFAEEEDADEAEEELPTGIFGGGDDLDALYPDQKKGKIGGKKGKAAGTDPVGPDGETLAELKQGLKKKEDEYNKLHYDSVVGGMKTRFRYNDVNAENFGFTDEDILTLDDRTLNMSAPMNCYATYLNKEENTRDRYKALHRAKNTRTLPADRKSRRYKSETVVFDPEAINEDEGEKIAEQTMKAANKIADATGALNVDDLIAQSKKQREDRLAKREHKQQQQQKPPQQFSGGKRDRKDGGNNKEEAQKKTHQRDPNNNQSKTTNNNNKGISGGDVDDAPPQKKQRLDGAAGRIQKKQQQFNNNNNSNKRPATAMKEGDTIPPPPGGKPLSGAALRLQRKQQQQGGATAGGGSAPGGAQQLTGAALRHARKQQPGGGKPVGGQPFKPRQK